MSIESAIEETIREAIARGEFDDLPGKGKPLDLSTYFETPEDLRMAFSILKSNEFVPEEVELMNEVASLTAQLEACDDESDRQKVTARLRDRSLRLRLLMDRRKR